MENIDRRAYLDGFVEYYEALSPELKNNLLLYSNAKGEAGLTNFRKYIFNDIRSWHFTAYIRRRNADISVEWCAVNSQVKNVIFFDTLTTYRKEIERDIIKIVKLYCPEYSSDNLIWEWLRTGVRNKSDSKISKIYLRLQEAPSSERREQQYKWIAIGLKAFADVMPKYL